MTEAEAREEAEAIISRMGVSPSTLRDLITAALLKAAEEGAERERAECENRARQIAVDVQGEDPWGPRPLGSLWGKQALVAVRVADALAARRTAPREG